MNTEEKNIEEKLKARFSHIVPNKKMFDETMEQVTKEGLDRSIILKGSLPSPYQSTYTIFVKKITYIGLPIIALVALLIYINVGVTTVNEQPLAIQPTDLQNVEMPVDVQGSDVVVSPTKDFAIDTTSIDTITASISLDSDADIQLAINDKEEDSIVNAELDNYNSVKLNTYETIL